MGVCPWGPAGYNRRVCLLAVSSVAILDSGGSDGDRSRGDGDELLLMVVVGSTGSD